MKDYLFDTNVLLLLLRANVKWYELDKIYHFAQTRNFISTGAVFGLTLLTADNDFSHLNGIYLDVILI